MDNSEELYEKMCKTCPRAVQCHEECVECDEFLERLGRKSAFEKYQDEVREEYEHLHWDIR